MNTADFKRVESQLGLKLPTVYCDFVKRIPENLRDWPPLLGETNKRKFKGIFLDAEDLLCAQIKARQRLGSDLPLSSLVFGQDGLNYYLIDASQSKPRIMLVVDGAIIPLLDNFNTLLKRFKTEHQRAWAIAKAVAKKPTSGHLSAETLLEDSKRLARSAVLLVDKGESYAAVWRGEGVVPPPHGQWQHWVSIDAKYLPQNPGKRKGVLSVYLCLDSGPRFHQVAVTHDPKAKLPTKPLGKRLFAESIESLPPEEALLRFGSTVIQDWTKANKIDPDTFFNSRSLDAQTQNAFAAYQELHLAKHPYFGGVDCYAQLGGWSVCFWHCHTDGYPWQVFEQPLTLLTVRESEPWLEVHDNGKSFTSFARIT